MANVVENVILIKGGEFFTRDLESDEFIKLIFGGCEENLYSQIYRNNLYYVYEDNSIFYDSRWGCQLDVEEYLLDMITGDFEVIIYNADYLEDYCNKTIYKKKKNIITTYEIDQYEYSYFEKEMKLIFNY